MKKHLTKAIAILALLVAVVAIVLSGKAKPSAEVVADTSWLVDGTKEYDITTAAQLLGLAELSKTNDFNGYTFYLAADIVLNDQYESEYASWVTGTEATNVWPGLGGDAYGTSVFKGVIRAYSLADKAKTAGERTYHTIYGMYMKKATRCVGFITQGADSSILDGVRFDYCYVESTLTSGIADIGLAVGTSHDKGGLSSSGGWSVNDIHAGEHTMVVSRGGSYTGGIVGQAWKTRVANSSFAGTVQAKGSHVGGIVGGSSAKTILYVYNCEATSTAEVTSEGAFIGGIVGSSSVSTAGDPTDEGNIANLKNVVYINQCRSAATITGSSTSGSYSIGGIMGATNNGVDIGIKITNSTFTGSVYCARTNNSMVGGIMGRFNSKANGTNAQLVITGCKSTGSVNGYNYVGGILGQCDSGRSVMIDDCYIGTGELKARKMDGADWIGGVIGNAKAVNEVTVTNCYSEATISPARAGAVCVGGIVGGVESGAATATTITDCLYVGKMNVLNVPSANAQSIGLIIGQVNNASATLTMSNCYADSQAAPCAKDQTKVINPGAGGHIVSNDTVVSGWAAAAESNYLKGLYGYQLMSGLSSKWHFTAGNYPRLKTFESDSEKAETEPEIPAGLVLADYTPFDYKDSDKTIDIASAGQYLALTAVSNAELYNRAQNWKGWTFRLTEDIDMNPGTDAAEWSASVKPVNTVFPIGPVNYDKGANDAFFGTITGKDASGDVHTLSGIYIYKADQCVGLTSIMNTGAVKDLILSNSYIQGTTTRVGAIAGVMNNSGTVSGVTIAESVYVLGTGWVSGIVGQPWGVTIDKCQIFGHIIGNGEAVGGVVGMMTTGTVTVSNTLFEGTVENINASANWTGGILGKIQGGTLNIQHSSSVGSVSALWKNVGALVGGITNNAVVNATDSLAMATLYSYEAYSGNKYSVPQSGAFIGQINVGTANITNCLGDGSVYSYQAGNVQINSVSSKPSGTVNETNAIRIPRNLARGLDGYAYSPLDFTDYWVAVPGEYPQIKAIFNGYTFDTSDYPQADFGGFVPDTEGDGAYHIDTPEKLLAFAAVSQTQAFSKDDIIYLDCDIVLNDGWDPSEKVLAPISWLPIGNKAKAFAGTFTGYSSVDWESHTISGLCTSIVADDMATLPIDVVNTDKFAALIGNGYMKEYKADLEIRGGLFSQVGINGSLSNFGIVNSYFYSEAGAIGSVACRFNGKMENCYSEAIVEINNTSTVGGLVGQVQTAVADKSVEDIWDEGYKGVTITNCRFGGEVIAEHTGNLYAGGIVGNMFLNTFLVIDNTIFDGTINGIKIFKEGGNVNTYVGGFIGALTSAGGQGAKAIIQNSLSVGFINVPTTYTNVQGSFVGACDSGQALDIKNSYFEKDKIQKLDETDHQTLILYARSVGYAGGTVNDEAVSVSQEHLLASNVAFFVGLDFEGTWALREGGYPIPLAVDFAYESMAAEELPNIYWYEAGSEEYHIETFNDLYGLALLARTEDFTGITIYIDNDIVINEDVIESYRTWGENEPSYTWTPISTFNGTIDGQGNTLSGFYVNADTNGAGIFRTLSGATIRDLKVDRSTFITTAEYMGALAGYAEDTEVNTVYVDALLTGNGKATRNIGGFFGGVTKAATEVSISNSESRAVVGFESPEANFAQMAGGFIGQVANMAKVYFTDCASKGQLSCLLLDKANNLGGFVGFVNGSSGSENAYVNFENCFSDCEIYAASNGFTGSIIGQLSGTATFKGVYGTNDYAPRAYLLQGSGRVQGAVTILPRARFIGEEAVGSASRLDFYHASNNPNGNWYLIANAVPELKAFAEESPLSVDTYDVLVYSRMVGGGDVSVAALSGSGIVAQNGSYTVTASPVSGLTFVGWFETTDNGKTWGKTALGDNYNGEKYSYTGIAKNNVQLVAVYKQGTVTVDWEIIAPSFNYVWEGVREDGTKWTQEDWDAAFEKASANSIRAKGSKAIGSVMEVHFNDTNYDFAAWTNTSGKIVSRDKNYRYTLLSPTNLIAVYNNKTGNGVRITYVTSLGQVYATETVEEANEATFPNAPERLGWTFVNFDKDEVAIDAAITEGAKEIVVTATYIPDGNEYTITVVPVVTTGTDIANKTNLTNFGTGKALGSVSLSQVVELTADSTYDGKPFVGYIKKVGDAYSVLGYNKTMNYRGVGNENIYAVYSNTATAPEVTDSTIQMINATKSENYDGKYTASFTTNYVAGKNANIVEQGILFMLESQLEGDKTPAHANEYLYVGGASGRYVSTGTAPSGATTLNLKNIPVADAIYARGYMIYQKGGSQYTAYTGTSKAAEGGTSLSISMSTKTTYTSDETERSKNDLTDGFPQLNTQTTSVVLDSESAAYYQSFRQNYTNVESGVFTAHTQNYKNNANIVTDWLDNDSSAVGGNLYVGVFRRGNVMCTMLYNKGEKTLRVDYSKTLFNPTWAADDAFKGIGTALSGLGFSVSNAKHVGNGEYMVTLTGKSAANFNNAVSNLTGAGFTVVGQSNVSDVTSATLTRGRQTIVITRGANSEIYVYGSLDNTPSPFLSSEALAYETVAETKLAMLSTIEGTNPESTPYGNGNSFVIHLPNGHFIVADGGHESNAEDLVRYLEDNVPEGTKPVIDAWIITHTHNDHTGALKSIEDNYRSRIAVEGVYYTVLPNETAALNASSRLYQAAMTYRANDRLTTNMGYATPTYRLTTGQKYNFAGVSFTVLLSSQNVPRSDCSDLNATSAWIRFDLGNSKTFVMTGDGETAQGKLIGGIWHNSTAGNAKAILTGTYLQVPHHGLNLDTNMRKYLSDNTTLLCPSAGADWISWVGQNQDPKTTGYIDNWNTFKNGKTFYFAPGNPYAVVFKISDGSKVDYNLPEIPETED